MTDQLREAAWAALDALERSRAYVYETDRPQIDGAMDGLRAALAEQGPCWCDRQQIGEPGVSCGDCPTRDYKKPEQEPVAWIRATDSEWSVSLDPEDGYTPLYTAPRCREWVGLTDEEIANIALNCYSANRAEFDDFKIARAIEAKLKEKNTC